MTFEQRNHTRRKPTDKRIRELSEKHFLESIEYAQTQLDKANSALINARAFFYHYKHANQRLHPE